METENYKNQIVFNTRTSGNHFLVSLSSDLIIINGYLNLCLKNKLDVYFLS